METGTRRSTPAVTWGDGRRRCLRCTALFSAEDTARVELFDLGGPRELFYELVGQGSGKIAHLLRSRDRDPMRSAWSFSRLHPVRYLPTDGRRYVVREGTSCLWHLNTLEPPISRALAAGAEVRDRFHFDGLPLRLRKLEVDELTGKEPTEGGARELKLKLHTTTYFYNKSRGGFLDFSLDNIIDFQVEKLEMVGVAKSSDPARLKEATFVIRDDTESSSCRAGGFLPSKAPETIYGRRGELDVGLRGAGEDRLAAWKLFHLSQFIGIGSHSALGFGHNTLLTALP